jgi:murein DD-endopeptidase MepM/ murein hydrolase activator NlpD
LFAAVALVAYLVQPGDTLSGIAASHGVSLAAVESANPQIANPNLIFVGQSVKIPEGSAAPGSYSADRSYQSTAQTSEDTTAQPAASTYRSPSGISTATSHTSGYASGYSSGSSTAASSSGYSTSSLSDIPGVPQSFAACVALRESTNLQNPAANGNAYGILPSSGYNVNGASLANQKQAFAKLYAQYGTSPWAPSDGC